MQVAIGGVDLGEYRRALVRWRSLDQVVTGYFIGDQLILELFPQFRSGLSVMRSSLPQLLASRLSSCRFTYEIMVQKLVRGSRVGVLELNGRIKCRFQLSLGTSLSITGNTPAHQTYTYPEAQATDDEPKKADSGLTPSCSHSI
jgi:hypothetical protein